MATEPIRENTFLQRPLRVVVYDPYRNTNLQTVVLLGNVAPAVATACSEYSRDAKKYDKILRDQYGASYKQLLGLDVKDWKTAWLPSATFDGSNTSTDGSHVSNGSITGGNSGNDGNITGGANMSLDYDDDIESLLRDEPVERPDEAIGAIPGVAPAVNLPANRLPTGRLPANRLSVGRQKTDQHDQPVIYNTSVHVYPEDKFTELKDKIQLCVDIPTYRQHLFYITDKPNTTYKIYADGVYPVDIRSLATLDDKIYDIPIDRHLYDLRGHIRVEAMDMFQLVESLTGIIYVVDLAQCIAHSRTQLLDLLRDSYQMDLLYYGFVIKYWPVLGIDCFRDYLADEGELQHKYPDMARSTGMLSSMHRIEKEIVDYNYKYSMRASRNDISIAITHMIAVIVPPRVLLNIRGIFDNLRVTRCIPEIHAHVEHNGKKYLLRKSHIRNGSDIVFPSNVILKNGITLAISLRKEDQDNYHAKKTSSTMENEQSRYMFLNIWPNGRIHIRSVWNEEDEYSFDTILQIMRKFVDPLIESINSLGRHAFMTGTALPKLTKFNVSYQSLNICVFWKKSMLGPAFKIVKSMLEPYMRAGIISQRNVQQFDKYEFTFKKGMHQFDTSAIERIIAASNNITIPNYYLYLSNNTIAQKWNQNYEGRTVKLVHRATDIRFEISDIREHEFQIFRWYIALFAYRASQDERLKAQDTIKRDYTGVKKLRKLREQDPNLYNLKKYGSKKVYSIVCQNQRQPLIYTSDEIKQLSQTEIKKLVQYWNFTLEKPAYYTCPNKKYPNLSFITGVHPKHYCLPCCSKRTQDSADSKKTRAVTECLRNKIFTDESSGEISRHIMIYGKDIEPGRLSRLPTVIYQLLGNNYYLFGVPQHLPGSEHAGFVFAVAEALQMTLKQYIDSIVKYLRVSPTLFNVLIGGNLIDYYATVDDFITALGDLFKLDKIITVGLQRMNQWAEVFTELTHVVHGVNIYVVLDARGDGNGLELYIHDSVAREIMYLLNNEGPMRNSMILLRKQNSYYPLFEIDPVVYFKKFTVEKRVFERGDSIINIVFGMLKYHNDTQQLEVNGLPTISIVGELGTIVKKYINRQNKCYAVVLKHDRSNTKADKAEIYVPVDASIYIADGIPLDFGVPSERNAIAEIKSFVAKYNALVQSKYTLGNNLYTYGLLSIHSALAAGSTYAVELAVAGKPSGMLIYTGNTGDTINDIPIVDTVVSYIDVNKAILDRTPRIKDGRERIGEALYNNYMYQLFIVAFMGYLDSERNKPMREKLTALLSTKQPIVQTRRELRKLLGEFPDDYNVIQSFISTAYYAGGPKNQILEQLDVTVFDFDRSTLGKLRKMPKDQLKAELETLSGKFCVYKDIDDTKIKFPNVFLPCDGDGDFCSGKKLIVNKPISDLTDLLAADLQSDLKSKYILSNVFADAIVNYFKFIRRPTELISVYKLD